MRSSSGSVPDILWLNPADITHKIGGASKLHGSVGGAWDTKQAYPFHETAKFKAIEAHYLRGVPWIETELFTDAYRRRLEQDGHIRGIRSLPELAARYSRRLDKLAASLRKDGFLIEAPRGRKLPLPSLLIGRGNTVSIGNQGNHRLALAQILGITTFAGRITCRHPLSSR